MARTVDGALYVPNESDQEMADLATTIQAQLIGTSKPTIHFGTKKTLGKADPAERLYVLGHGTVSGTMVVTAGHPKQWTPDQLATQLIEDGLPNMLKSLELLVCNAAKYAAETKKLEKLNTINLEALSAKYVDEARRTTLIARYQEKEKKYEEGRKLWTKGAIRSGMVEPFAFRLSRALKQAGFAHLTVYAYNFAVSKTFKSGTIHIQAPQSREATDSDIVQF